MGFISTREPYDRARFAVKDKLTETVGEAEAKVAGIMRKKLLAGRRIWRRK
jgi:hypothetical protein